MLHKVRMHFTAATSAPCRVQGVSVSIRISGYAVGAALVAATPSLVEPFVPAAFVPAIELAGTLATAAIAARAATRIAGVDSWKGARSLLRDIVPHAPKDAGGAALGALRLACGVDRVRDLFGRLALARVPKLLGGVVARGVQAKIPGAGIVLQGVRAVTSALDAVAMVTTLEALARRSVELADARASLTHVDFPGACEPTVSVAA